MQGVSNRGRQAFRLKGTMPALTTLSLLTGDLQEIERQLAQQVSQMPQFFLHAPVLVDLEGLGGAQVDLTRLAALLREKHLVPVAVKNPSDAEREQAIAAGFGILTSAFATNVDAAPAARASQDNPRSDAEPALAGETIRTPVRSGQVIYAAGGDLVALAPVSSGAEIIADGHIHVYAPLRGRALAGAHGNSEASIFTLSLEAEFLSIDGYYLMSEEIPREFRGKPARISLVGEELVVTKL